jgi:hypothetical protein
MSDEIVKIKLDIDNSQANKQIDNVEKKFKSSGEKSGKQFAAGFDSSATSVFKGALFANLAANLVAQVAGGIKNFLKESVALAAEQQRVVNELNAALKVTGTFSKAASKDIQDFASSLQETSVFGDEAILKSAAYIQTIGKVNKEQLKQALQAAVDLSAGTGRSLDETTRLIARAATGQVEPFSRLGLTIQKGATAAESFKNTIATISAQFGGRAKEATNTYAGATKQLSNAWGDFKEELGRFVTEGSAVISTLKQITSLIQTLNRALRFINPDEFTKLNQEITATKTRIEQAKAVLALRDSDVSGWERFKQIFATGFTGSNIQRDPKAALARFEKELIELEAKRAEFQINEQANQASKLESDNMFRQQSLADELAYRQAMSEAYAQQTLIAEIEALKQQTIAEQAAAEQAKVASQIAGVANILTNTISQSMQSLGASLVNGENFFKGFLGIVLNAIGDLLIYLGISAITIGKVAEGLRNSIIGLFGGQAIVAGLVAIATGGAVKAYASSVGAPSTNVASAGTSTVDSGTTEYSSPSTAGTQDLQEQVREQQTVQVVINGNYYDTEGTRLQLVNLLNDSFETDGARLFA